MADESRISPYNLADCKNTTDDALQNYLSSLPSLTQSNFHTDVKLALGYSAVLISAVTFAFDYQYGFEATKTLTTIAVILYFALNGAFTYWIWGVEKGIIFTGSANGKSIAISSRTQKYDPTYRLTVKTEGKEVEVHKEFMEWFTDDGFFVAQPFQQWLASSVPLIGEADPKNAAKKQTGSVQVKPVHSEGVQDVLDTIQRDMAKAQAKANRRRG